MPATIRSGFWITRFTSLHISSSNRSAPDVGLKTPPPLTVGLDPESGVVHVVVLAGLREVPEPAQPATHVLQLRLDGLQSPSLFAYQAVRLSGNDFRRIGDG